jgi:uncharacterized protein YdhG (YjbR/CyaY superfamily)
MSPRTDTQKSAKSTSAIDKTPQGFSEEEKAAMKERAKEIKAEARLSKDREAGESAVLAKIAELPEPDRSMAQRFHDIVKANAPDLMPRSWYGMPAYTRDGKVVCFFQAADKFKARYATLGFDDTANLDDGDLWPTYFALKKLTPVVEAKIAELVKKAVS